MSLVIHNIYKHVLMKDGTVIDIKEFINTWCKSWNDALNIWPEISTAMFLRKYIND